MKEKKMLFGIGIAFLFLATVSLSYAYFTTTLVNKDVKDQIVTTGTLELTYTDGPEIVMNNIKPGATITKEISVKNTGTLNASYNLVWQELVNEIRDDEILIRIDCTRLNSNGVEDGTCGSLSTTTIKSIKIIENVSIEANVTHKYNIFLMFKENNSNQNYNQGKKFSGVLNIEEYKPFVKAVSPKPIYCTFDGDMVQGTEYTNGKYIYRYKQKRQYYWDVTIHEYVRGWENILDDGWGVIAVNADSNESIETPLCTYINDKPLVSTEYMFLDVSASSVDFSTYNMDNVVYMQNMFFQARIPTIDVSSFNLSEKIDLSYLFNGTYYINSIIGLDKLDTSKATNMSEMFNGCNAKILDLSNFNTSKVTNMSAMFKGCSAKIIDLSSFDTRNVTNMSSMFSYVPNTVLIDVFDTNNVTDMGNMFNSSSFSFNFNKLNTQNVITMNSMFSYSPQDYLDLKSFNTSKVIDMDRMFENSEAKTINLNSFDTSNVTTMKNMFSSSKANNLNLSSFDTSKVTNMSSMFSNSAVTELNLNSFDTSNVTDMSSMFSNTNMNTLNLSSFDTNNVTNMGLMFYNSKVKTIYASDKFVTDKVSSGRDMFSNATNLIGGNGTKYNSSYIDKTYARIDTPSIPGYFTLKNN